MLNSVLLISYHSPYYLLEIIQIKAKTYGPFFIYITEQCTLTLCVGTPTYGITVSSPRFHGYPSLQ